MTTLDDLLSAKNIEDIRQMNFGEAKICALSDSSLLEFLVRNQFEYDHISKIVHGRDWQEKLDWAKNNFTSVLKPMGFNGSHYSQIVTNAGWQEKLDWVTSNYNTLMKPLGFTQSQTAKIVKGKEWLEKVSWIEENYESNSYSTGQIQKIMAKQNWKKVLPYSK